MNEGYIKLHRKTLDSRVFQSKGLLKVWIWCLLKANHKSEWVPIKTGKGSTEVLVEAGQFIFGRFTAAKKLKMKPSTLWDRIIKLKNMQNIDIQSNRQYSLITVTNWELYQANEKKPTSDPTGVRQASDTNKNDKNDKKKKEREKKTAFRDNVLLTEKEYKTLIEKHGEKKTKWILDKLSLWKEAKGTTYKSDYAAINMWVVKAWEKEIGQDKAGSTRQLPPLYGSPEWKERYPEG